MRYLVIAVSALVLGVVLGLVWAAASRRAARRRRQSRGNREQHAATEREAVKPETMKRVIWACLFNGFAWVWCSYILAYMDKVQIAESLSQVAVTEIIGVVLAYAIKSVVENLSKNNRWPDKGAPPEGEFTNADGKDQ